MATIFSSFFLLSTFSCDHIYFYGFNSCCRSDVFFSKFRFCYFLFFIFFWLSSSHFKITMSKMNLFSTYELAHCQYYLWGRGGCRRYSVNGFTFTETTLWLRNLSHVQRLLWLFSSFSYTYTDVHTHLCIKYFFNAFSVPIYIWLWQMRLSLECLLHTFFPFLTIFTLILSLSTLSRTFTLFAQPLVLNPLIHPAHGLLVGSICLIICFSCLKTSDGFPFIIQEKCQLISIP